MPIVLILYPALFASQSKFVRKVIGLTRNLSGFTLAYLDDPRGFIEQLQLPDGKVKRLARLDSLEAGQITHAIVFDDGEEFVEERTWLADNGVAMRWVKTPLTRVVNIKREPSYQQRRSDAGYEYIGRGSYWGNPHATFAEGESREEVIRKYAYDFTYDKFLNIDPRRVHELAGKRLGCFCKPAPCHGDVLADYLNGFDDGK